MKDSRKRSGHKTTRGLRYGLGTLAAAAVALLLPAAVAVGEEVGGGAVGAEAPSNEGFLQVWQVSVEPDAGSVANGRQAFKDNILFEADGNFTAEAFGSLGFGRVPYTLSWVDETTVGFTLTMSNGSQGTLVWNGVLAGEQIVGTVVWTKPDGEVGTYNFTAVEADFSHN